MRAPGPHPSAGGNPPLPPQPGPAGHETGSDRVRPAAPASVRWPLKSFLELGALPGAVPCARLHARQVLWEWGFGTLGEAGELIVSELVTNAVNASGAEPGPGSQAGLPAIRLALASDRRQVLVEVWDSNPHAPTVGDPGLDGEGGRGLLLVEAVCVAWGCYPGGASGEDPTGQGTARPARGGHHPRWPPGKTVWALAGPSR